MAKFNKTPQDLIDKLYERHLAGESITEIAKKEGLTHSAIHYRFKSRGLKIIKGINSKILYRKKWNELYFETIDTPEKAYWLGLIASDGSIIKGKTSLRLIMGFKTEDIYILDQFLEDVESKHYKVRISDNHHTGIGRIELNSSKIVNDLLNLGIRYGKSYNGMSFPKLDNQFYSDFIRGFLDGDGWCSISKDKNRVYIAMCCTCLTFLEGIQKILSSKDINSKIYAKDNSKLHSHWQTLYTLSIADNLSKYLFIKYCYTDPCRFLKRKLKKMIQANTVLSSKSKILKQCNA